MSPRRRGSGDTIGPAAADVQMDEPEPESAFDIAQGLLSAALDEVRTSPPEPVAPAAAEDTGPPVQTRRRSRRSDPVSPATADDVEPPVRTRRPSRRRLHALEQIEPEGVPTPTAAETREPAGALDGRSGHVRRRSRRAKAVEAPAERESDVALLASIEVLEQEADRIRRGQGGADLEAPLPVGDLVGEPGSDARPSPDNESTLTDVPLVATVPSAVSESLQRERPRATAGAVRAPRPRTTEHRAARPGRRAWIVLGALLAVVAIGVAALATTFGGGGTDRSAGGAGRAASEQARFAFDPVTTPEGLRVERVWVLQGKAGGHFVGRLSFANPTSAPVNASHIEVIPKALASSVDDVRFDPEPVVLEADPVVQYSVTVPAGKEVTATYEIAVEPDGAARGQLESWADDLQKASRDGTASTTTTAPPSTTTPSAPPATVPAPPPPPPTTGAIVIWTVSRGGIGTFSYSGPGGGTSLSTASPDSIVHSAAIPVPAGTYSWTQVSAPPGSTLVGIGCNDADSGGSGATATFNVQPGETVACTWTNQT